MKKNKGTAANLDAGLSRPGKTRKVTRCEPGGTHSWMDNLDYKAMKMDGYDDCAIGIMERIGEDPIIVYDKKAVLEKLASEEGMTDIDAIEWYEYNMIGAYMGVGTPGFITFKENL